MKDTFILKTAWKSVFNDLNDRQAGVLIKAVFNYIATGDKPELTDAELKMAFRFMQLDIDTFTEKYKAQVRTNMENGKKGGNPNFGKGKPNPYYKKDNPKITQITDHNPNGGDTDNDNDNGVEDARAREIPPHTAACAARPPETAEGNDNGETSNPFEALKTYWNLKAKQTTKVKMVPITWLVVPPIIAHRLICRMEEYGGFEKIMWAIDRIEYADFWHGKTLGVETFLDDTKFPKFLNREYENFTDNTKRR